MALNEVIEHNALQSFTEEILGIKKARLKSLANSCRGSLTVAGGSALQRARDLILPRLDRDLGTL